jgi:predicted helicase
VQILDPAAGTGTFLVETIKQIHKKFEGQQGIWNDYVDTHLIPRLNGFELLMASYAMAHLKIDLLLKETGYTPKTNQRLRVFLTNSLEEPHSEVDTLFSNWLTTEAYEANKIKNETPVMCVIGNPPYSGESANKGAWIMNLMEDYKKEPGGKEKLKERNPKWINDDYMKFVRYGQHFIEKNGTGILAFINPHGFLDNPTFRGVRWNLMKTFDKIYTIDLHGNSKKKETSPDGSIDENVFDIQQGVSINVFVKTNRKKEQELGKVFHFDLYGQRNEKYEILSKSSIKSISYNELKPNAPNYLFLGRDFGLLSVYEKGFKVNELFPLNSVGIVTARDGFTIHNTKKEVENTIIEFLNIGDEAARIRFDLGKDVRDWQVGYAKKDLEIHYPNKGSFTKIEYRPFDTKWTFYTGKSKGFHCYPRHQVMQHFIAGDNLGLAGTKLNKESQKIGYTNVFITNKLSEARLADRFITYILPLYLYPESNGQQSIGQTLERTPNLNSEIVQQIAEKLGLTFTPEKDTSAGSASNNTFAPIDILDYIYAVLHSPAYREKYKEFLKIDFPRVPYPKDAPTFWSLVEKGGAIRALHLLESPLLDTFITTYPESGTNQVGKVRYDNEKVYINETQYFDKVPQIAWEFYIGGYQPAQKWLKDRKDRVLTFEDILHYQKIIIALTETDRLMKEIDGLGIEW